MSFFFNIFNLPNLFLKVHNFLLIILNDYFLMFLSIYLFINIY